eukprot:g27746.t1
MTKSRDITQKDGNLIRRGGRTGVRYSSTEPPPQVPVLSTFGGRDASVSRLAPLDPSEEGLCRPELGATSLAAPALRHRALFLEGNGSPRVEGVVGARQTAGVRCCRSGSATGPIKWEIRPEWPAPGHSTPPWVGLADSQLGHWARVEGEGPRPTAGHGGKLSFPSPVLSVSLGEEVAQSTSVPAAVPTPPAELLDAAGDLVREAGLVELGLGGYTPVGMVQNILEFMHLDLGLPWWGAIVA